MDNITREENELFEDETRRIARSLWPQAQDQGSILVQGREYDGCFETEECIHLIEATTSRKKEKIENDAKKLNALISQLARTRTVKAVRGWIVTRDEPTADQRKVVDKYRPQVRVLSFAQFQSQLVDSRAYLEGREKVSFGSVKDPSTGALSPAVDYVEQTLLDSRIGRTTTPAEIVLSLQSGGRFVLLGDYGAGKSMTLRWLFRELRSLHLKGKSSKFPVYVNLRDHYGQSDPTEVLERHARNVGFLNPGHLVRAWRAGHIHLLLDGFDEVTTLNIQGLWKKLHDNRYRAMEAIRRLIREHPSGAGLAISGRAHFFDSLAERHNALGLPPSYIELELAEFTNEQIKTYLHKSGLNVRVPAWIPSRPLLLAYLASRGAISDVLTDGDKPGSESDPARGWDTLIGLIAQREAEIEAGIDGQTVRRILERLSTKARRSSSGLGPFGVDTLIETFREICGYDPDERAMMLLQRLPGLGVDRAEEGTRTFIDEDYVDVCRAGDLVEFIENPFGFESSVLSAIECPTGLLGIAVAAQHCCERKYSSGKINAAINKAVDVAPGYLQADLACVALECGHLIENMHFISDIYIPEIELTVNMGDGSNIEFQECFFGKVGIDPGVACEKLPRFRKCYIGEIDGRVSREDLPHDVFDEQCIIESFTSQIATTSLVMSLSLPLGVRVLLTILKKLYQQRGTGRKENALFRGLDHGARRIVPDILRIIAKEGLAIQSRRGEMTIWLPDRGSMQRVGRILASPNTSNDQLVRAAEAIK